MYPLSLFKSIHFSERQFHYMIKYNIKVPHNNSLLSAWKMIPFKETSTKMFYTNRNYLKTVTSPTKNKMWSGFLLDIVVASPASSAKSLGNYIDFYLASHTFPTQPSVQGSWLYPLLQKGGMYLRPISSCVISSHRHN